MCIDDMHDKHYVADVVINHALSESILFSKRSLYSSLSGAFMGFTTETFFRKRFILCRRTA